MTQVSETHSDIEAARVDVPFDGADVVTYVVKPKEGGNLPSVVILHENTGTRAHFENLARRLALEGFIAAVPDALSLVGGTPTHAADATALIKELDRPHTVSLYGAVVTYLKNRDDANGKVGALGFCWGGGMANQLAIHASDLAAAIVFYGGSPADEDVAKIRVPLHLNYAELDERINAGVPGYEAALKAAGKPYELHMYEGAGHAFFNEDRDDRYHQASSELAWPRILAFLKRELAS